MMSHKSAMGENPIRQEELAESGIGGNGAFDENDDEEEIMRRVMEESLKMHEEEQKR